MNKLKEKQNIAYGFEKGGKEFHVFIPECFDVQEVYLYKNNKKYNFTLTQQKDE